MRHSLARLALALVPSATVALEAGKPSDLVTLESNGTTDAACPFGGTPSPQSASSS